SCRPMRAKALSSRRVLHVGFTSGCFFDRVPGADLPSLLSRLTPSPTNLQRRLPPAHKQNLSRNTDSAIPRVGLDRSNRLPTQLRPLWLGKQAQLGPKLFRHFRSQRPEGFRGNSSSYGELKYALGPILS